MGKQEKGIYLFFKKGSELLISPLQEHILFLKHWQQRVQLTKKKLENNSSTKNISIY